MWFFQFATFGPVLLYAILVAATVWVVLAAYSGRQ